MSVVRLILVTMFGLDLYWWRVADHRLRLLRHGKFWRGVLAVFMAVMLGTLCTRMLAPRVSRTLNSWVPLPIVAAQYLWHLMVLPAIIAIPFVYRAGSGARRVLLRDPSPKPTGGPELTRRQVIAAAAVAAPPLLLGGGVGMAISQLGKFRTRRFDLQIPNLPPRLDGLSIVHLSDFHVGRFMTPAMMRQVIDTTNDMKPDLVLVTGDLIDYALVDLPPAIEEIKRLRPKYGSREGLAMCIGNHDVIESGPAFRQQVRAAGVPILVDESKVIEVAGERVELLGINWFIGEAKNAAAVQRLSARRDPGAFPILMAHHPHAFDEAARQGIPLTLAGHTHGGQLMVTEKFGAGSILFRYWSGLYRAAGNASQLVVSNGIGNWFPLRVNAPAEIVWLTLNRA